MTFEAALELLANGWELSHLVRMNYLSGPPNWQAILQNEEDGFMVCSTGGTPGEAISLAWEQTFNDTNFMRIAKATPFREPPKGPSLAQSLGLIKPKDPLPRRF